MCHICYSKIQGFVKLQLNCECSIFILSVQNKDSLNFKGLITSFHKASWVIRWLPPSFILSASTLQLSFQHKYDKILRNRKENEPISNKHLMIISHQFHFIFRFLASHQNIDVAKKIWQIKHVMKNKKYY